MADIIFLSSSPARQLTSRTYEAYLSSSPGLPTLDFLIKEKPSIPSGSRATSITQHAEPGFSSAGSLLKNQGVVEEPHDFREPHAPNAQSLPGGLAIVEGTSDQAEKTSGAPANREARMDNTCEPKKEMAIKRVAKVDDKITPLRKSRAKKSKALVVKAVSDKTVEAKEKAPRKPRVKKTIEEGQTKIPKGRVTKSVISDLSTNSKQGKTRQPKTSISSHHFEAITPIESVAPTTLKTFLESEDVAIPRRREWTPPSIPATSTTLDASQDSPNLKRSNFDELVGSFNFKKAGASVAAVARPGDGITVRKRKLVELVKTNLSNVGESASKLKAVKKRPVTITELATAAYAIKDDESIAAPLLRYTVSTEALKDSEAVFKKPAKSRAKSPVKRTTVKNSPKVILLSPQSALKHTSRQEFVFGTSSQLAQDESPSFLRELHTVMQMSNCEETTSADAPPSKKTKGLWSAGARGDNGELLTIETIDLTVTPAPARPTTAIEQHGIESESAVITVSENKADEWQNIDDTPCKEPPVISRTPVIGPVEAAIRETLLSSPSIETIGSNAAAVAPPKIKTLPSKDIRKPDYASYTDAQLAKEIKKYHFKPVKRRDGMIALLEKCWEGKQRLALGSLGTNAVLQVSPSKPPATKSKSMLEKEAPAKRPRGRPRKEVDFSDEGCKAVDNIHSDSDVPLAQRQTLKKRGRPRKEAVDEISDSDPPMTPSPPRRRASLIGTPPLPLALSIESDNEAPLSPTSQLAELYKHITRAVNSDPRSNDPQKPTWLEKIQLYDPIVLEDLAAWLNTGKLQSVGWDGEVGPVEVKGWCLERSVCCLWRENLRGGTRARY